MKLFIYGDEGILKNYSAALSACGARSYIGKDLRYTVDCAGLLLAGGGDINPAFYGERRTCSYNIDIRRDRDEMELIRLFMVTGRPILGICRGIQILNVALQGTILQNVKNTKLHRYSEKNGDQIHKIRSSEHSFLRELYGNEFSVNSAHHQAVGVLADALNVSALSEDHVIEAVENREKKLYAVQFHPERMAFAHRRSDTVDGRYIFDFFLGECH